jgi:hypothetical protein
MPTLCLRFKKKSDGNNVLSCVRDDGSATWQHQRGDFFVHHDLTHYAIETTLGLSHAFYGLLAQGWEFTDFGTPWPRGRFPDDALPDLSLAEHLAGAFDLERATNIPIEAEGFNTTLAETCQDYGIHDLYPVTEPDLTRIRTTYAELIGRWRAMPPGATLELTFPGGG